MRKNILLSISIFFISQLAIAQIPNTDSLDILMNHSFPFVGKSFTAWEILPEIPSELLNSHLKKITSPELKQDTTRYQQIYNYFYRHAGKIRYSADESLFHIYELTLPATLSLTGKDIDTNITIVFIRVYFGDNIYKWQIREVRYQGMENIITDKFTGINSSEANKLFTNFIMSLENPAALEITNHAYIHPSVRRFFDDIENRNLRFRKTNGDQKILYILLNVPYYDQMYNLDGYRYLILRYYKFLNADNQIGWLMLDEGDMTDYFIRHVPNSYESFYIKQFLEQIVRMNRGSILNN